MANRSTNASSMNWAWLASPRVCRDISYVSPTFWATARLSARIPAAESRDIPEKWAITPTVPRAIVRARATSGCTTTFRNAPSFSVEGSSPACSRAFRAWPAAQASRSASAPTAKVTESASLAPTSITRGPVAATSTGTLGMVPRHRLIAAAVPVVECDFLAAQEPLHLRNIAREILARRRSLPNLGDRGIASANFRVPHVRPTPPERSRSPEAVTAGWRVTGLVTAVRSFRCLVA